MMEPKKQKVITYFFKKGEHQVFVNENHLSLFIFSPCTIDIEDCDHESHPLKKHHIFLFI